MIPIAGIGGGLVVAGVPHTDVAIACLILLGLGIAMGVPRTRAKD